MVNGIDPEEVGNINNWRAVHIQAGFYQINIASTHQADNLDDILVKARKELLIIKDKIPIDKVPVMGNEIL